MKNGSRLILGAVLGATLLASSFVWADGGPQCRRPGGNQHAMAGHDGYRQTSVGTHLLRHVLRYKQELGLSDEQIGKLRGLALDADKAGIRANADVLVSERELRSLLWDEKAELAAIEAKVREHESFEATARIIGIKARRDLIGVLTPEQREKRKALREQRHRHPGRSMHAEGGEPGRATEAVAINPDGADLEISELEDGLSAG
jgi:protein CpxP